MPHPRKRPRQQEELSQQQQQLSYTTTQSSTKSAAAVDADEDDSYSTKKSYKSNNKNKNGKNSNHQKTKTKVKGTDVRHQKMKNQQQTTMKNGYYNYNNSGYHYDDNNNSYFSFLHIIHPKTIRGMIILFISIVVGIIWNRYRDSYTSSVSKNSLIHTFLHHICMNEVYCHIYTSTSPFDNRLQIVNFNKTTTTPTPKTKKMNHQKNQKKMSMGPKEIILRIPRHVTIWDIDAMKNDWIYQQLIQPAMMIAIKNENENENNMVEDMLLSPAAYLAVYLARLTQQQQQSVSRGNNTIHSNDDDDDRTKSDYEQLPLALQQYIQILPKYHDYYYDSDHNNNKTTINNHTTLLLSENSRNVILGHTNNNNHKYNHRHPALWTMEELNDRFNFHHHQQQQQQTYYKKGTTSTKINNTIFSSTTPMSTYYYIRSVQQTIFEKEYNTFCYLSPKNEFQQTITRTEYDIARLNVLSRSFGTGPNVLLSHYYYNNNDETYNNTNNHHQQQEKKDVVETLFSFFDFTKGSHVMVPILDLYNHHGTNPNVEFHYDTKQDCSSKLKDKSKNTKYNRRSDDTTSNAGCFVIQTIRSISNSYDIWDKYGERTDTDLYAKYGFINYDQSDYTQASLALYHDEYIDYSIVPKQQIRKNPQIHPKNDKNKVFDLKLRQQMLRYMQYDDGYEHCLVAPTEVDQKGNKEGTTTTTNTTVGWRLKKLKYQYLLHRATLYKHWIILLPPRNHQAVPPPNIQDWYHENKNEEFGENRIHRPSLLPLNQRTKPLDVSKYNSDSFLFSTCRVMVVTEIDYNGTIVDLLEQNMYNTSYVLPRLTEKDSPLEYRTFLCLARMIQSVMKQFHRTLQEQYHDVLQYHGTSSSFSNIHSFGSMDHTLAYLKYGEMQTLEELKQIIFQHIHRQPKFVEQMNKNNKNNNHQYKNKNIMNSEIDWQYTMRNQPCPFETSLQPLLHDTYE